MYRDIKDREEIERLIKKEIEKIKGTVLSDVFDIDVKSVIKKKRVETYSVSTLFIYGK